MKKTESAWLKGGGEMGDLIRSMDWSKTALGPIDTWPQSLRTTVSTCLSSTFPILICWGPEDIQIYNDAYRPICGVKHPDSMGMAFKICWETALPVVGAKFDRAHEGEGVYIKDQQMILDRSGYLEEAFMTFSFSPIRDESGNVGGIFHPITETTGAMLSARRTQLLRDFTAELANAKSIRDIIPILQAKQKDFVFDLPFFAMYELDEDQNALLIGASGVEGNAEVFPMSLHFGKSQAKSSWPLIEVLNSHEPFEVGELVKRFGEFKAGAFDMPPEKAMILPLKPAGSKEVVGFFIAGVSSARALDSEYRGFYSLLQASVVTAVSNIRAYEEEQKRAEALAAIDRAKTTFFSNVSHEFRTPLTLILGPLEDSLNDTANPLNPVQHQRQTVTHRNALRLLKLVNSLLDFSRIEAGRMQASFEQTDLAKHTSDLASVFRSATDRAGLELKIETDDLANDFYVDRDMWEKIVLNLISNAFKFTFEGSIQVRLVSTEMGARLEVIDTGSGIPADEIPKLFERFHRVQGAKGRSYEGTGIGLALVQELVKMHGGTMEVTSELDRGSTFAIEIPRGKAHLPQDKLSLKNTVASTASASNAFIEEAQRWIHPAGKCQQAIVTGVPQQTDMQKRILLADDNADMREYVRDLLSQYFQVETAADGLEALEKIRKTKPDLVLTDVMMPNLDGFGLLKELRAGADTSTLAVILLSARAGEEARVEGLQAGATDYLVKPFSARELIARVASALNLDEKREEQNRVLREAQEAALQASKSKSDFLANMSHEIRTPLGVILGFSDLLENAALNKDNLKWVQTIKRNAEELTTLINDILDLSKVEAGRMEIETLDVDLVALLKDVEVIAGFKAREKGIDLQIEVDPGLPRMIKADPTRVRQILVNLLSNATKFTEKGFVKLKVDHSADGQLRFRVIDTGIGMNEAQVAHLFEPFQQADASTSRRFGGTGLGLALSRRLARGMGGDLLLTKTGEGRGSEFEFHAPLPKAASQANFENAPKELALSALQGRNILLVEDSHDNRVLITRYLKAAGADFDTASDGSSGIEKAMAGNFDVVLMDIQMPILDGYEAMSTLRSKGYVKPIIALTAHAMKEERDRALKGGFDDYLTKPIDKQVLIQTIADLGSSLH